MKILIAEDELDILDLYADFLRQNDFKVETAVNGKIALEKFQKDNFDLAIVDLNMPVMNGVKLCHEIKKIRKDFPIIIVTGWLHMYDKQEIDSLDVLTILKKPIQLASLLNEIKSVKTI